MPFDERTGIAAVEVAAGRAVAGEASVVGIGKRQDVGVVAVGGLAVERSGINTGTQRIHDQVERRRGSGICL